MNAEVLLDTALVEGLWNGGRESEWLAQVADGKVSAALSALSLAELARRAPDRRAEIQLMSLVALVEVIDLNAGIARRAGAMARALDSDESAALTLDAAVAATALESDLPIACVDDDFFTAMGCQIADPNP